jgi:hypothetical protein
MTVYYNKGTWTNDDGKRMSPEEAYAVTGLCNTESAGEHAEAQAVADYEKLRDAENN